ncbi:MAG: T9SS type A sorting domain-containing protein [Bacteroidetes bacterium]|nr:MAG: T9SS type A sorting domain-containing protein [Bacteroidota bacterium]
MFYRHIIAFTVILILASPVPSQSQIIINEIMASSYQSAFDEDNDSPDWIELYNNTSTALNLKGYRISDKKNFSGAWKFPDTYLNAGERLLVFASDKNRTGSNKYVIEASGEGINQYEYDDGFRFEYLKIAGDYDIQMRVNSLRNSYFNGSAGLIMREGIDERSKFAGVFCFNPDNFTFIIRKEEGTYPEIAPSTIFKLKYPNGWVRLKRQGDSVSGYTKDLGGHWYLIKTYYYPAPNSMFVGIAVSSSKEDMLAKAVVSDLILDGKAMNYDTLSGVEINTDITGKSYYSNELHTDFKLSSDGETLYLWNSAGELSDSMSFPALTSDVSYGRYPDGSVEREYFSPSTPGNSNQKGNSGYAELPKLNIPAGWYNNQLLLRFENNNPNLQIRYTTDGTDVSDTSTIYDKNSIVIDSSVVIRAKAYQENLFPSKEIVNTYILNDNSSLPVVSFAISPKLLWDTVSGIFNNKNIWPAPEIEGNFELFDNSKTRVFSSHSELSVHGGNSRTYAQKSLKLTSRGRYESSTFVYPFFGNNYLDEFNGIIFRNSGIDWQDSKLRDALCSVISEQIPSQRMAKYRPYVSFLNGRYWGLYDLREKLDEFYLSKNYHLPVEGINIIDQDEFIMYGRIDEYDDMKSKLFSSDMSKEESYKTIDSLIDIENLIDYLSLEIYCNNMDWPWNNIKVWNSVKYDGKWRWMLHDLDWTFGLWGADASFDVMKDVLEPDRSRFTKLFLKILENNQVRERFLNKFADLMNSVFLPNRLNKLLDSLAEGIEPEMQRHIDKWGISYQKWQDKINKMRNFINERPGWQRTNIVNHYGLSGYSKVALNVNIRGSGTIKINTLNITDFPWEGYYFNKIPVPIKAISDSGYKFKNWNTTLSFNDSTSPEQMVNLQSDAIITANFDKIDDTAAREIWSNNLSCYPNPFKDKIAIKVISESTQKAEIEIQNLLGQKLKTITTDFLSSGINEFTWDGTTETGNTVSNGIYFCILSTNKNKLIYKIIKFCN